MANILTKLFDSLFTGMKASGQGFDPNNELIRQLYNQIGINLNLLPYEVKSYVNKGYLINPHLYTVINKIIKPASGVQHYLFEKVEDKEKEFNRYKAALKAGRLDEADYYSSKALKPVKTGKDVWKILDRPNEMQSWEEFTEQGLGFYLLTGEEFIYGLQPEGMAQFSKIYGMPSQLVVMETSSDWQNPIKGYRMDYWGLGGTDLIDPSKVLQIKYFNPEYDGRGSELRGLSPVSPLCKVVKKNNDTHEAQMRLVQNGHPIGILSSAADRGMTKEQADELQARWDNKWGRVEQKGKVMMTSAQLNWLSLGLTSGDMQLMEGDKLDLETISRVYGVPLPIVLNDASSYNNMKEANKAFWGMTILPLLDKRKAAINRWLLPAYSKKYGKDLYIDYDIASIDALKMDENEQVDILVKEIQNAMITPNEARERRMRERINIPEMDLPYIGRLRSIDKEYTYQNDGKDN